MRHAPRRGSQRPLFLPSRSQVFRRRKIGPDQASDYAARKCESTDWVQKWLAENLAYYHFATS